MSRTNIDIDDKLVVAVMKRYRLTTKREAVNFALGRLAGNSMSKEEALAMQGSGWEGDLAALRASEVPPGF